MRSLLIIAITLSLGACGKRTEKAQSACEAQINGSVDCGSLRTPSFPLKGLFTFDSLTGVPREAERFSVFSTLEEFNSSQTLKIAEAERLLENVITSEEFRDAVVNHTIDDLQTYSDNGGLSNEDIYLLILQGAEKLYPVANYSMDLHLRLYFEDSNIMGYTSSNSWNIMLNLKYFESNSPEEVAGNLMHEWLHKLGFMHAQEYSERRQTSVPYAVGYIVRRLAQDL